MLSCSAGLSSTTSKRLRRGVAYSLMRVESRLQPFGRGGLGDKRECTARQAMMPVFIQGEHLHRNVPRAGILLQMVQHRPAQHVGQEDIERNGRGMKFVSERRALRFRACATRTLNPLSRDRSQSTRA